jgi:hypothetical protein
MKIILRPIVFQARDYSHGTNAINPNCAEFDDRASNPDTLAVKKENTHARSNNARQEARRR